MAHSLPESHQSFGFADSAFVFGDTYVDGQVTGVISLAYETLRREGEFAHVRVKYYIQS